MLKAFDEKITERIESDVDVTPIQNEIRKNIYEIDKILHPKKYAKHFILGNKTITFE